MSLNLRLLPSYIQYQNAPKLNGLIDGMQELLLIPIDEFYNNFLDIMTCDTQGLDNWGVILNVSRNYFAYSYAQVFGFNTGVPNPTTTEYPQNFGHGSYFSDFNHGVKSRLNNAQYRFVLLLTYQRQAMDCSVRTCSFVANNFIQLYHNNPAYNCTIIEGDRHFTYDFNYQLEPFERTLFNFNQELPKPAGIGYSVTWRN